MVTVVLLVLGAVTGFVSAGTPSRVSGTINVWVVPEGADAMHDLAQSFMREYPSVRVQVTPLSWEILYARILQDVSAGTGAFDVATWDVMTAGSVARGMLDLEQFGRQNPDLVLPGHDPSDFDPIAWKTAGLWEGKNIGFPFYLNTMFLYYRKDLFNDPNLKSQFRQKYGYELTVPDTWQKARDVAEFFTRRSNRSSPTEYGIALMFPRTHTTFYEFLIFFGPYRRSEAGLKKFGPINFEYGDYFTSDLKPAFDSPEGVAAINTIKSLLPFSPDPLGSDYGETIEYFARGLVAMVPQWGAAWASFKAAEALRPADQRVGVALMPGGHSVSGNWGLGVNASSKNPAAAYVFAQYATSKAADKAKFLKFGLLPTRTSTLNDPEVKAADPRMAVLSQIVATQTHRPRIPEEPRLEDVAVGTLTEILLGSVPAEQALRQLAQEWMKILGR